MYKTYASLVRLPFDLLGKIMHRTVITCTILYIAELWFSVCWNAFWLIFARITYKLQLLVSWWVNSWLYYCYYLLCSGLWIVVFFWWTMVGHGNLVDCDSFELPLVTFWSLAIYVFLWSGLLSWILLNFLDFVRAVAC